jgi:hypothetical protein
MAETGFVGLFNVIEANIGVNALLVFILVFTLVFAILQKTKIIGEGKKNFNVIVSLILALFTVIPHILGNVPAEKDPVFIISNSLPSVSVIVVAILGVLLLVGVFGKNLDIAGTSLATMVALGSFAIIVFIFGASAGWWNDFPPMLNFLNDSDTRSVLITLLVFAIVIWFVTSDDDGVNVGGGLGNLLKGFKDSIK